MVDTIGRQHYSIKVGSPDAYRRTQHGDRDPAPGAADAPPFGLEEVVAMSAEISTATGSRYGLERMCHVLEFPRSTIYAKRTAESGKVIALRPRRRDPTREEARGDSSACSE